MLSAVAQACNLSTCEAEAREPEFKFQPGIQGERACLKPKPKQTKDTQQWNQTRRGRSHNYLKVRRHLIPCFSSVIS